MECKSVLSLLKEIQSGNTGMTLSVVPSKNPRNFKKISQLTWRESPGSVTIKLASTGRTYTISLATFEKVLPYLRAANAHTDGRSLKANAS